MADLIQRALKAKRESKYIEFKASFDLSSTQDWCEIIKDIVAMANGGGGVILVGVDDSGQGIDLDVAPYTNLDLADITDKIFKYTGIHFSGVDIAKYKKGQKDVALFLIEPASIPMIFTKPGTYPFGSGKQRTAFGIGTLYFRHGAKSEPGNSDDIRKVIERELEAIRKSWIKGVRQVVQAPRDTQVMTVSPKTNSLGNSAFRIVNDPNAPTVNITRNPDEASGIFVHEELSEGIFDEINNVIDANTALARGQKRFFLGNQLYYRIYAERQHVRKDPSTFELLAHAAVLDFYSPGLHWFLHLERNVSVKIIADLIRNPKSPNVHFLLKLAILLGQDFADWLFQKWQRKWRNHSQPPSFFLTFKKMKTRKNADRRVLALRTMLTSQLFILKDEPPIQIKDLLDPHSKAADYLSRSCLLVFEGDTGQRSIARQLDCLAYGSEIENRSAELSNAIISEIDN